MKTLKNHKLLIDNECPMCRIYGGAFESFEYVEKGTCLPYQHATHLLGSKIDSQRARNEIALYNAETGKVTYGVSALVTILENRFPYIGKAMQLKPLKVSMDYIYKFISQNRKVIAPSANINSDCTPDLDLRYRLLYVTAVALLSCLVIFSFTDGINYQMGWNSSLTRELFVCFGQIIWQILFFGKILKERLWEYIGNLSTVSLIGTILLLPGFFFNTDIRVIWFTLTVLLMTLEHLRRSKLLQIGLWPTVSWLAYRFIVLGLIIYFN